MTGIRACTAVVGGLAALSAAATEPRLFDAKEYRRDLIYLAADARAGRGTGSPEKRAAARYIAQQFAAAGLQPGGDDDTFLQSFDTYPANRLSADEGTFRLNGEPVGWRVRRDWVPLPYSLPGSFRGPVTFAGYGIAAAEHDYDDFADLDVTDRVLIVFRYEPRATAADATFGGTQPSEHASFVTKAEAAAERGAAALLLVDPPSRTTGSPNLYPFAAFAPRLPLELPVVHVQPAVADALLAAGGAPNLATLEREIEQRRRPASRGLRGVHVTVQQGLTHAPIRTQNVVGVIPAQRADAPVVVVGAHYDHLGERVGRGTQGRPAVFNGADDNASGTATLLTMARAAAARGPLDVEQHFVAFAAEEIGLLGSQHYVRAAESWHDRLGLMVNLDMCGRRYGQPLRIFGIETDEALPAWLGQASRDTGVRYEALPELPGVSDNLPFQRIGVPIVMPFTGLHADYHRPTDDWELIDIGGALDLARLMHAVVTEANAGISAAR